MSKDELIKFIEKSLEKRNYHIKITTDKLNWPIRDLQIDSLLAFAIITDIEKALNYQAEDEELLKVKTLNDLLKIFIK
ncbi:Phosphopantetheine-binding protein [[Mycoplasma] cavipharyngis]|uniref:phosphopantetheine-binding protein n=1 Tax=[Mycoplasma] cavipharyngis TaxID=92757 RepID=UPI003704789A